MTGYRISYTDKEGSEQSRDVSDASTKDTIANLTTGSTYSISVMAISGSIQSKVVGPKMVTLGMRYGITC